MHVIGLTSICSWLSVLCAKSANSATASSTTNTTSGTVYRTSLYGEIIFWTKCFKSMKISSNMLKLCWKIKWHFFCGTRCILLLLLLLLQPFNGLFSRTTWVSLYQKGKTNVDFTGTRDSEWQWHQLGHMQVCTSLQTDNHASIPPLCFVQAGCKDRS